MIKVVIDTNVYLSALIFQGIPLDILKLSFGDDQEIQIFTSDEILRKIARVLSSPKFSWTKSRIRKALSFIIEISEVVEPRKKIEIIFDQADNRILECAVESKADYIISGDRHLLSLREYKKIRILNPSSFVSLIDLI